MKQYQIITKNENSTKSMSIWADEYHENEFDGLIFTFNNEVIAILDKKDFIVKE